MIGSRSLEYPWQFTLLSFISSLLYHNYLLPYLYIFIYSFLFLHFALEFARCPYRIWRCRYIYTHSTRRNKSVRRPSIPFAGEREVLQNSRHHLIFLWKCRKYLETKAFAIIKVLRADVSKYRPEVYKSGKSKILQKINNVALGKLLT